MKESYWLWCCGLRETCIIKGYEPPISISLIRNVMPAVIAADIIGVQPMTGPVGQIHTLRTRYGKDSDA